MKKHTMIFIFVFGIMSVSGLFASDDDKKSTNSKIKYEWIDSDYQPQMQLNDRSAGYQFGLLQSVILPKVKLLQAQAQGKELSQSQKFEQQIFSEICVKSAEKNKDAKDSTNT